MFYVGLATNPRNWLGSSMRVKATPSKEVINSSLCNLGSASCAT